jgi:hypothetical protein
LRTIILILNIRQVASHHSQRRVRLVLQSLQLVRRPDSLSRVEILTGLPPIFLRNNLAGLCHEPIHRSHGSKLLHALLITVGVLMATDSAKIGGHSLVHVLRVLHLIHVQLRLVQFTGTSGV